MRQTDSSTRSGAPGGPPRAPRHFPIRDVIRFEDRLPPPIRGRIGEVPVQLHVWPPDVIPSHPEAFRPRSGALAGYWVLVRFG
jgi:hypothetical protein